MAEYRFDEQAGAILTDYANSHNGLITANNGITQVATAWSTDHGGGILFDSTNGSFYPGACGQVNLPNTTTSDFFQTLVDFTVEAWVKIPDAVTNASVTGVNYNGMFGFGAPGDDSDAFSLGLVYLGGGPSIRLLARLGVNQPPANLAVARTVELFQITPVNQTKWFYVSFIRRALDGSHAFFYNGATVAVDFDSPFNDGIPGHIVFPAWPIGPVSKTTGQPVCTIGQEAEGNGFFGEIGRLHLYNVALTPAEIASNFNATAGRFVDLPDPTGITFTEIQSRVTKTAAFTGLGLDVSRITGDWTINIQVDSLSDFTNSNIPVARFGFEDTVTDYTTSMTGPTLSFKGSLDNTFNKVKSFKKQDFPSIRIGVANSQIRLKLLELSEYASGAATPTAALAGSCTYRSWIEY